MMNFLSFGDKNNQSILFIHGMACTAIVLYVGFFISLVRIRTGVWRSEDSSQESVLLFHHMVSEYQTQVDKLGVKSFC